MHYNTFFFSLFADLTLSPGYYTLCIVRCVCVCLLFCAQMFSWLNENVSGRILSRKTTNYTKLSTAHENSMIIRSISLAINAAAQWLMYILWRGTYKMFRRAVAAFAFVSPKVVNMYVSVIILHFLFCFSTVAASVGALLCCTVVIEWFWIGLV